MRLISGDCIEAMRELPDASVDAIVTDPPYGLGFMGKAWDDLPPGEEWGRECLRVLKPGGHLLAFGGSRTYHRLACAVEDAGFEVRDQMMWLYGSGFPKSLDVSKAIDKRGGSVAAFDEFRDAVKAAMAKNGVTRKQVQESLGNHMLSHYLTAGSQPAVPNLRDYRIIRDTAGLDGRFDGLFRDEAKREVVGNKQSTRLAVAPGQGHERPKTDLDLTAPATSEAEAWNGWGTALKPAHEPIVVARKPLAGTVAENVLRFGTGALNIDGCRIGRVADTPGTTPGSLGDRTSMSGNLPRIDYVPHDAGRWPANVVLDEEAGRLLDEQSGEGKSPKPYTKSAAGFQSEYVGGSAKVSDLQSAEYGDTGGASRFFYCAKASKGERNAGLDGFEEQHGDFGGNGKPGAGFNEVVHGKAPAHRNHHPTVKPISLMRYLVRLVTPPEGTVLDPFLGSGTTGCAAVLEGFDFIGIEREAEYLAIAEARIAWWDKHRGEGETDDILKAAGVRDEVENSGQLGLLDEAA